MRTLVGKFKTPYTKKVITQYLQAVYRLIGKSPTFRDLKKIPGPSPRTVVRHFGKWSIALKQAGIRPQTNQLMKGERSFIRLNWRKMTDKTIAKRLGLSVEVVKYYRSQFSLWKNRKGTSKQKFKSDGMKIYGKSCEVCNFPITELHHIVPRSIQPNDWSILCPNCHSAITRKLVQVNSRTELASVLRPFIKQLYSEQNFTKAVVDNDTSSI